MTELPFQYPVIGIAARQPGEGEGEYFREFRDERAMRILDRGSLDSGVIGMLLVDNAGRNWEIQGVKRLGAAGSLLGKAVRLLFRQQEYHVELDIVEKEPISFGEFKERLCKSMEDNPDDWRDDEAIAGEDSPPRDEQEMMEERKAHVRKSRNVSEILEKIDASV